MDSAPGSALDAGEAMRRAAHQMTSLVALLSVLLSTQGGMLAHALFQLRQAYIAAHLCENRFEPSSNCHGMCFLKKRVAEADAKSRDNPTLLRPSTVLFFLAEAYHICPRGPGLLLTYADLPAAELEGHDHLPDPPPRRG